MSLVYIYPQINVLDIVGPKCGGKLRMKIELLSGILVSIAVIFIVFLVLFNPLSSILFTDNTDFNNNMDNDFKNDPDQTGDDNKFPPVTDNNYVTEPVLVGSITIEGSNAFKFDPREIKTVRSDIFKEGYFSLFDILVHLDSKKSIDLNYHFEESMNTHVIDSINGISNWWYYAYYSGGWSERNAFRMDHYPYKDNTTIKVFPEDEDLISDVYKVFEQEVKKKELNEGAVIIPKITINGPKTKLTFSNVKVTAHNKRSDMFQPGVITALDAIMSLGDQNKIEYELKWYEEIAFADPVKNYWVHRINDDEAYDTCGWVYEEGSNQMHGRNHIHIPSDSRVLNSPDYEEWFWICL
jgi:hypothetical protein